ncbi:MAG: hypothetical protein R3E96_15470 [Planctomycetota bacterium]
MTNCSRPASAASTRSVAAPRSAALDRVAVQTPRRPGPHVALVGKGITYDTGGLSLKVGGTMVGMKSDMGGVAAVLGASSSSSRPGSSAASAPSFASRRTPSAPTPSATTTS